MKKDVYHYKQKTRILLFFHHNPSRKDLGNRVEKENASNMLIYLVVSEANPLWIRPMIKPRIAKLTQPIPIPWNGMY